MVSFHIVPILPKRDPEEYAFAKNPSDPPRPFLSTICDYITSYLYHLSTPLKHFVSFVAKTLILLVGWLSIFYVCSKFHALYCTPSTWLGFIQSAFVASTPYCVAAQWVIYYGGQTIRNIWIIVGSRLIQTIIPV